MVQCVGAVVWYNGGTLYGGRARFRPYGGAFEWNPATATRPYRQPIVKYNEDGCKANSGSRLSTPIRFEGDPRGMPIVDIAMHDIGGSNEYFGVSGALGRTIPVKGS